MTSQSRPARVDSRRRPQEGALQEGRSPKATSEVKEEARQRPGAQPHPGGPQEGAPAGGGGQRRASVTTRSAGMGSAATNRDCTAVKAASAEAFPECDT